MVYLNKDLQVIRFKSYDIIVFEFKEDVAKGDYTQEGV